MTSEEMSEPSDGCRQYLLHACNMWEERETLSSISPDESLYRIIEEEDEHATDLECSLKIDCVWSVVRPAYDRPFRYVLCSKCFTNELTSKYPFECQSCGEIFENDNELVHHMRTHTNELKHEHPDPQIYAQTYQGTGSRVSMHPSFIEGKKQEPAQPTLVQDNLISSSCEVCGKVFPNSYQLKSHMATHRGERFECPICGRSYSMRQNLKQHMNIHDSERAYTCETCGKLFSTNQQLQRHQKTHSDERTFKCEVCDEMFKRKTGLTQHMKVHRRERC